MYRGIIANFGFISPKEFMKLDTKEVALLEAILVDMEKKIKNAQNES